MPSTQPKVHPARTIPASAVNAPGDKGTESIGTRLRKRRRTDSSPTDESSPAPKRAQSKKATASSGNHGQAASAPKAASSTSKVKPKLSQQAKPPFTAEMNQGDLLAMQLEQPNTSETTQPEAATNTQPQPDKEPHLTDHNGVIPGRSSHGETLYSRRDSQVYDVMGKVDTESFHHIGASFHLKTQSLPILDNLVSL